jgi:hypothetical protein
VAVIIEKTNKPDSQQASWNIFQGASEPKYAARSIMSGRLSEATVCFISGAMAPLRLPLWNR